jgi:hypothetical protein
MMLLILGGRERSEDEFKHLVASAGLKLTTVSRPSPPSASSKPNKRDGELASLAAAAVAAPPLPPGYTACGAVTVPTIR